jgi:hypothetical protein
VGAVENLLAVDFGEVFFSVLLVAVLILGEVAAK